MFCTSSTALKPEGGMMGLFGLQPVRQDLLGHYNLQEVPDVGLSVKSTFQEWDPVSNSCLCQQQGW